MRPPGLPCALTISEGKRFQAKLGRNARAENAEVYLQVSSRA